jgi:hypothetical protein
VPRLGEEDEDEDDDDDEEEEEEEEEEGEEEEEQEEDEELAVAGGEDANANANATAEKVAAGRHLDTNGGTGLSAEGQAAAAYVGSTPPTLPEELQLEKHAVLPDGAGSRPTAAVEAADPLAKRAKVADL